MSNKNFQKLVALGKKEKLLAGVHSLLSWDQETYMPKEAGQGRGEQIELLAGFIHKIKTSKAFLNALKHLIDLDSGTLLTQDLKEREKAAVIQWRRDWKLASKLPNSFVKEFAKTASQSIQAWSFAKNTNSFHSFAPFLEKMVDLNKKKADFLGYDATPYDALLDEYEPGLTTKKITDLFSKLTKPLTDLINHLSKQKECDDSFLFGTFSKEKQKLFFKPLLKELGFDLNKGRLDFSEHPFSSTIHPKDHRITTHSHTHSILSTILAVLHEAGHALYEMGLPEKDFGTPLSEAISYGMHESQSRLWETKIGLSYPFWTYYFPQLQKLFPQNFKDVSLKTFFKAINKVKPSFIRIQADEVTYPLHIILRFELELALLEGSLKVKDLPCAWNANMQKFLKITPKNDTEGCLQDIHWSMGAFGYFPSYALGNLFASHLFLAFKKQSPKWEEKVAQGNLLFIKEWLNKHIHQYGRQYSSQEILLKATCIPFSEKAYLNDLKEKYMKD